MGIDRPPDFVSWGHPIIRNRECGKLLLARRASSKQIVPAFFTLRRSGGAAVQRVRLHVTGIL
jgi:hypothetical protein